MRLLFFNEIEDDDASQTLDCTASEANYGLFDERRSCQDLAQTTHHYVIPQKRRKPALEHARQRVQRVKAHTDQPPVLPAEHPRHCPHLLQQAHHAIAAQAVLELGEATEPLLAPDQQVMGETGQEQDELLRFPLVLAPFHNP